MSLIYPLRRDIGALYIYSECIYEPYITTLNGYMSLIHQLRMDNNAYNETRISNQNGYISPIYPLKMDICALYIHSEWIYKARVSIVSGYIYSEWIFKAYISTQNVYMSLMYPF